MSGRELPSVQKGWLLVFVLIVVSICYWPGLSGGWLFDDYPNIVDNRGVQPADASLASLVNAALSSPASEFRRPLASLSFAANYLATGLNPYWMKLTNLLIHLLNGVLVFLLAKALLPYGVISKNAAGSDIRKRADTKFHGSDSKESGRTSRIALCIATAWMLLPINLTAVLYVVQRMESLANIFVLIGLLGYTHGRHLMLYGPRAGALSPGFTLCLTSITVPTIAGVLGKETAVLLPFYGLLLEWCLFGFRQHSTTRYGTTATGTRDLRIIALFLVVIGVPLLSGLFYLLPLVLQPKAWATRDFTMETRLLSEARVVVDYVRWTIIPTPHALSFYHDDFDASTGLWMPWTTLASIAFLVVLVSLVPWLRLRYPLAALGVALFIGSHLLTATILPLELIYEHRNYFASFGLMLVVIPILTVRRSCQLLPTHPGGPTLTPDNVRIAEPHQQLVARTCNWALPAVLALLMAWWISQTALTAYAWGDPLRLAKELAARAPDSPRAQYELGRTYIIYSHYDPTSPYTRLAYTPLEKAASLPKSSILPQQALIFMSARMHLPIEENWWDSMITKLETRKPGVQDESSLIALMYCMRDHQCLLSKSRMNSAFQAAISHPEPSARILAAYGEYAWNLLSDVGLGEQLMTAAIKTAPGEAAYRITLFRMLISEEKYDDAKLQLAKLQLLNVGGYLDNEITAMRLLLPSPGKSQ